MDLEFIYILQIVWPLVDFTWEYTQQKFIFFLFCSRTEHRDLKIFTETDNFQSCW